MSKTDRKLILVVQMRCQQTSYDQSLMRSQIWAFPGSRDFSNSAIFCKIQPKSAILAKIWRSPSTQLEKIDLATSLSNFLSLARSAQCILMLTRLFYTIIAVV